MTYDVHIFAVVRVKIPGVDADNQQAAIRQALQRTDLDRQFDGANTEYAEEITSYLVDEVGDEEYKRTRTYLDKHHLELAEADKQRGVEILDTSQT